MVQLAILLSSLVSFLGYSLVVSQSINSRQIDQALQNRIDKFVENVYLPSINATGCGLAIVQNDGQLLYTTGYGYANHQRKIRNGNQTQFLLASTSKSIAAVVVVKTLQEYFPELDEAVLDTPIRNLMPQINLTLNDRVRSELTTFRDLLAHRMCIPRNDISIMTEAFKSTAEILYRQRYTKEGCGFRSEFSYNNQMVLLASNLIEQLIGESFVDYTERFLRELGMHDSAYIRETDDFSEMENRAMPYYTIDGIRYQTNPDLVKRSIWTQSVGGLYASPNDMIRFMRFQLNLGELDGKQIVPKSVMSWLSKPSIGVKDIQFKKSDSNVAVDSALSYGLGLMVGMYNGWEWISHDGVFSPYRSEMSWYPALKIGIFSSTHESPNLGNGAALHIFIFEALRGNVQAEELAVEKLKQKRVQLDNAFDEKRKSFSKFLGKFKKVTVGNVEESSVIGNYGHPASGQVEVFRKFNTKSVKWELYVSHGKWAKGWMEIVGSGTGENESTSLYKVYWDTDIFQDNYAMGVELFRFVTISKDGIFTFMLATEEHGMSPMASFRKGVETRIEHMDPIPWKSDRCE